MLKRKNSNNNSLGLHISDITLLGTFKTGPFIRPGTLGEMQKTSIPLLILATLFYLYQWIFKNTEYEQFILIILFTLSYVSIFGTYTKHSELVKVASEWALMVFVLGLTTGTIITLLRVIFRITNVWNVIIVIGMTLRYLAPIYISGVELDLATHISYGNGLKLTLIIISMLILLIRQKKPNLYLKYEESEQVIRKTEKKNQNKLNKKEDKKRNHKKEKEEEEKERDKTPRPSPKSGLF